MLLARGADPGAADEHDWTTLHHAAGFGHAAACEALLTRGAAHGAVEEHGVTALEFAELGGHAEVAALLRRAA